jgi:hypothetical protein
VTDAQFLILEARIFAFRLAFRDELKAFTLEF